VHDHRVDGVLLGRDVLGAERYIGWVHGVRGGDVWQW
jgi:hypothetical protein